MSKSFWKISLSLLLSLLVLFSYGCEVIDIEKETENQTIIEITSDNESGSAGGYSSETQGETQGETQIETPGESQTEFEDEAPSETESELASDSQSESSTETQSIILDESEVESETDFQSETDCNSERATESETETETETETEKINLGDPIDTSDYAQSLKEALERSERGEVSGSTKVPDQAPIRSEYMPMKDGKYVKNNEPYYIDEDTYVVVDALGNEVFRIYRGGGYISIEEVAAYVYAFGDIPANYTSSKKTKPTSSIWGEFLRLNHSKFTGDTSKYRYEPELPRISGCGGDLIYYEIDIGTTGTDCDPSYPVKIYNNGSTITRGAARIVYARFDANNNKIIDPDEKFVFYTYNHYNDFQEYLNYYGGWGEMFGNITGGGQISSNSNCNPTPYVPVIMGSLNADSSAKTTTVRYYVYAILPEQIYGKKWVA